MKLIVAGATGFVATEVIRQALSNPAVTSIVALARRETALPQNAGPKADTTKFKPVVCADFGNYPESVKKELSGADACIWYKISFLSFPTLFTQRSHLNIARSLKVTCQMANYSFSKSVCWLVHARLMAITPSKSRQMPWEEVKKICLDYTITGLETISQLPRNSAGSPFRFIYTSGSNAERDQNKKPWILGDYSLMRVSLNLQFIDLQSPQ
jgi:hypothetical protein